MGVVFAIVLTVIASSASTIGKAFQKEATKHLPKFSLDNDKVFQQYRASGTWVTGVGLDLIGGAIQTVAFALAPVSLLQPISGIGLAGLAVYSHVVMKDTLTREEWLAVCVAALGTLGLGVSSASDAPGEDHVSCIRMVSVLVAVGYVVLVKGTDVRERLAPRNQRKLMAAVFGLQAGGMFGLSASTVRTGFIMSAYKWTWAPFGVACGLAMSGYGFVLQTCGLKEGSAVIVCTCLTVSSMVVGVVTGIVGLGEPVPSTVLAVCVRLWWWACIVYGVVVLSGATKQVNELVAYGIDFIPAKAWHHVPDAWAIKVKNWQAWVAAEGSGASGPLSPKPRDSLA
jgi:hypothetical protein